MNIENVHCIVGTGEYFNGVSLGIIRISPLQEDLSHCCQKVEQFQKKYIITILFYFKFILIFFCVYIYICFEDGI